MKMNASCAKTVCRSKTMNKVETVVAIFVLLALSACLVSAASGPKAQCFPDTDSTRIIWNGPAGADGVFSRSIAVAICGCEGDGGSETNPNGGISSYGTFCCDDINLDGIIDTAVSELVQIGKTVTYDLGGEASTSQVGDGLSAMVTKALSD
jgi:hypothetical protein